MLLKALISHLYFTCSNHFFSLFWVHQLPLKKWPGRISLSKGYGNHIVCLIHAWCIDVLKFISIHVLTSYIIIPPLTVSVRVLWPSPDTDLHAAIKARILQDVHKQYILYQLFKVIKYLHSGNVIHRDLKVWPLVLLSPYHCCYW